MKSNQKLNRGTTTVDNSDQPIFVLSKLVQWHYPDELSTTKYQPMLGGLHIQQGLLQCRGRLVEGTGLDSMLSSNNITTIGVQTAAVDVKHIKKSTYALQITAVSLYRCLLMHMKKKVAQEVYSIWLKKISPKM